MTPKELLKEIKSRHQSLYDRYYCTEKYHFDENNKFLYDDLEKNLNELERLKKFKETFDNYELAKKRDFIAYENWLECEAELNKTPTVDEVCKALSEFSKTSVYYEYGNFLYRKERFYNQPFLVATKYKSGLIEITKNVLPPHLITMIGRFYEGLEVKE